MSKIILWGSTPESPTAQRLLTEARALGYPIHYAHPQIDTELPVGSATLFNRFTALNYNDSDLELAIKWQDQTNHRVVNDPAVVLKLRDKYLQYQTLKQHHLPVIETTLLQQLPALNEYREEQDFVVKPLRSNGGRGLMLIKGKESLYSIQQAFHDLKDERFVVQPRVKKLQEFRLFAFGLKKKKTFIWIERIPLHSKEYRGNRSYTQERLLDQKECTAEMLELQEKCDQAFSTLLYWGADVVLYKNEQDQDCYALFELNTSPGIIGPETLSGQNIAAELIQASVGNL